ncbi:putative barnase/colicin E5 family endoribonuclease [Helicobacter cetorum]|uniref:Phage-Barnase-EndoU-ColicinE5/D-RelE like nuclease 3 domain-containing protein n=1 Tax=Helicobacter cetorum (strain ATCC BAA-540 / CCUG 52418 / MIT 99-5656) TaxID=1163745 RepID=I0EQ55_HELCM|nr:DUF3519 domain-containing protein [Helicobacter cetorum]AFI05074.1 hypothetical protein HCD_00210 [Helicobacter cetorum MIT 99-5656]
MYRDDLGGIDFVWGKGDKNGYGLEHILERREQQAINNGLSEQEAKEYALNVIKSIPEILEKGEKKPKGKRQGIEYNRMRVGLSDKIGNKKLNNQWVISSYEVYNSENELLLHSLAQDYKGQVKPLNSLENNHTTENLTTKEPNKEANTLKAYNESFENKNKEKNMKKLSFDEIKQLIDNAPTKGKDILLIGNENLTPEIVEYIHKKQRKVGIEKLNENEIKAFNFEYPKNAKIIIDYQGIQHALNKHGVNSANVRLSKQLPITYTDIANYRNIVNNADETIKKGNRIMSYKQINGHFVVVEQINRNQSEFLFKTMFKEKGNYKNGADYKKNISEN